MRTRPLAVFVRSACATALLVVGGNALSLPGKRMLGHYDFGYAIRGDRPARPLQVFDDGAGKIYFQVRPGAAMPAVFAGSALALLVTQPEGQYYTARTGDSEFTLALGAARASVRRGDAAPGGEIVSGRNDAGRLLASAGPGLPPGIDFDEPTGKPAHPSVAAASEPTVAVEAVRPDADIARAVDAAVTHEQPVVFPAGKATLTAAVRAALSALVVRIGRQSSIVVEGHNDFGAHDALAQARALALRDALLARGVPAGNVDVQRVPAAKVSVPSAPRGRYTAALVRWTTRPNPLAPTQGAVDTAVPAFDIALADRDIATSLRRWARSSGYDIVWDVRWVAPVNGAMRVDAPSFLDAVGQVVAGLRAQGYPVKAQAYTDHVVRFATPD